LFTLARADAGQYPLELTNFYLDDMLGECLRSVRSLSVSRGLSLSYEPPADEIPFRGDERLLNRMIINLLDNAIKHTPASGNVSVTLKQDGANFSITIKDTGDGIPAEAQPHIFERFYRADKARGRNAEANGSGAGLGLSIAQWVAGLHGGRIVLDHSDQNGSTFVVFLPVSADAVSA
jgi:signal transduction histidine kinase